MNRLRRRFALLVAALACPLTARAGLDEYVRKPDGAFAWSPASTEAVEGGTIHHLKLTSQVWQGITWTHNLAVIEPLDVAHPDATVLLIAGGQVGDGPRSGDIKTGLALAKACRSRVAVLGQVPNQPLLGDKSEDALIAETFVRYLETKDGEWPLLFPMVKSAVRAMDAVQAFARGRGESARRFVVTGASKRGWTTWLSAACDPRIAAIAPMVIPTLKLEAQNRHQLENFNGQFSEEINDYTERGLTRREDDPDSIRLRAMVDPFTYRDRLAMPKLQINGTNDPYWTLDSLNLYWDDLAGPKWVVYLPNAGHSLEEHRDYAIAGIGALYRHAIGGGSFPKLAWKHDDQPDAVRLTIESAPAPRSAKVWTATSRSLDFRKSPWTATEITPAPEMIALAPRPGTGNVALFADLEYEIDGFIYHLSTQIRQTERKPAEARP